MHLHVLALDLDGTLAKDDLITEETWEALRKAKSAGITLILVTGRRLEALSAMGPFDKLCRAIVAENGAIIFLPDSEIILSPFGHLPEDLLSQLNKLDIPLELGEVIAASWEPHDKRLAEIISQNGYSASIEYNKGAVMVLPQGATKGTGLLISLKELGFSAHNVVACGDGENDRSFFEQAEVAVAVANATPEIKKIADLVLPASNGAGVRSLINMLIQREIPISLNRKSRLMTLGETQEDSPLCINPLTLTTGNLAIAGSSESGKSWLAGLLVEKLLQREYQVCIIDPEGDYGGIRAFPQTLVIGGKDSLLPPVEQILTLIEYTQLSLILDLSIYTLEEKKAYITSFLQGLKSLRAKHGKPHCLLIDEAHYFCPFEGGKLSGLIAEEMKEGGVALVSYRPSLLAPNILDLVDNWMITQIKDPAELDFLTKKMSLPCNNPAIEKIPNLNPGKSFIYLDKAFHKKDDTPSIMEYKTFQRVTQHVRHLHKYLRAPLPASKQFYFNIQGSYKGLKSAASLWEFSEAIKQLPLSSIQYHLQHKHFEKWLTKVLHDKELSRKIRKIARRHLDGEFLREELSKSIKKRYDELEKLI